MTNSMMVRRSDRGSIMVISMISLIPVLALVTYSLVRTASEARAEEVRTEAARASANALSGIELAKAEIMASEYYDSGAEVGRNMAVWDTTHSDAQADLRWDEDGRDIMAFDKTSGRRTFVSPGQMGVPGDDVMGFRKLGEYELANRESVTVWIAPLDGLWHLIEAEARVNRVRRTARIFVRERDPFTRYNLFVDKVSQPVSVSMTGNVHSNETLRYMYGDLTMGGYMTAVSGFTWQFGADWTNIDFKDGFEDAASRVELPSLYTIRQRLLPSVNDAAKVERGSDFIYVGTDYVSCDIQLDGSEAVINARKAGAAGPETVFSGSIADVRRIYTTAPITMRGDLNGRLSIATEHEDGVTIDDDVRYVDSDGDPAWGGGGGTEGKSIDSVEDYRPNPNYDGKSSLGIMSAAGDINYVTENDADLEVHAALFAKGQISPPGIKITGPWADAPYNDPEQYSQGLVYAYNTDIKPRFLLTMGMSVSSQHKLRGIVNGSTGERLCGYEDGAYIYDTQLQTNPPPYFIDIERPLFRGRHLLEGRFNQ